MSACVDVSGGGGGGGGGWGVEVPEFVRRGSYAILKGDYGDDNRETERRETKGLLFLGMEVDDHGGFLSLQYSVDYQRRLATDLVRFLVT